MTKSDFFKLLGIDEVGYGNMSPMQKRDLVKSKANTNGDFYCGEFLVGKTIESIRNDIHLSEWSDAPKTMGGESVHPRYHDDLSFGALFNQENRFSTFRMIDNYITQYIFINYFHEKVKEFKNGHSYARMGELCWYKDYVLEDYLPAFNKTKEEFLTGTGLTEERITKELENTSGFSFDFIARICMYFGLDIERESRFATNLRLGQYLQDIDGKFPDVKFAGTDWNNLFKPDDKE